jgi:dihydropteroate synthase
VQFQLKSKGELWSFNQPVAMGIINVTPDSFFEGSRANTEVEIKTKAIQMIKEGAAFIDLGAMSTRPGAKEIPLKQECEAIAFGLKCLTQMDLKAAISVDTYRTEVARIAIAEGADFINDISAGDDLGMLDLVAETQVGYMAMHKKGMPADMQKSPTYDDVTREVAYYLMQKDIEFVEKGITSWCADPGFGFGKKQAHNFQLMRELRIVKQMVNKPLLVGISRKGMIHKTLGVKAEEALNGTTALHMTALMNGADILRVHDVKEAMEVIHLAQALISY